MEEQRRWRVEGWVALLAGLAWLMAGISEGGGAFVLAVIPGALMLSGGVFAVLVLGERWVPPAVAVGAVFGVLPFGLLYALFVSFTQALWLMVAASAAFVAAGALSLRRLPALPQAPPPEAGISLYAQLAFDEAIAGDLMATIRVPSGGVARAVAAELDESLEFFEERGWLDDPTSYHVEPLEVPSPRSQARVSRGIDFEHLEFESGYAPHDDEPGRQRWLGHTATRTSHAWVVRQRNEGRPWLMCLHGYAMGNPLIDFGIFHPRVLHERLGFNLIVPILPLHGPRALGLRSGRGFLEQPLDTLHAMTNAVWDLKRWLAWVRERGGERVGVYGLSMGGFTTALFSSLSDGLEAAIASIPVSDWSRILWYHMPPQSRLELLHYGATREKIERVHRPISPLVLEPRLAPERLAVFGAVGDRIVPPEHAQDLMDHWKPARADWFQGSHVSTPAKKAHTAAVEAVLRDAGLVSQS